MPNYMVLNASQGWNPVVKYYRKQSQPHVSHAESGSFSLAAQNDYAATYNVPAINVVLTSYRSGQGVPKSAKAVQI